MARQISNTSATDSAVTTALKAVNTTNYPATISGQTNRIADAHEIIQRKAIAMGLSILASEGDTKPSAATVLADSHKVMDTASAINSINNQSYLELSSSTATTYLSGNQSLNAEGSVYIPVGYNENGFTISAKALTDQTYGTATSAMLISGATALGSTGAITGSLSLDTSKILTTQSWTLADGTTETGDIVTQTPTAKLDGTNDTADSIIVDVTVATDNSTETLVSGGSLPAGYYPNAVNIYPRFSEYTTKGNRINIEATKAASGSGTVSPDSGYDYLAAVTIPAAATPTLSVTNNTTNVTVGTLSNSKYPLTGSIKAQTTYGTAGWIAKTGLAAATDSSVTFGYIAAAGHTKTSHADNKFGGSSAITSNVTSITGQYFKDVVTAGYIPAGTTYYKVLDASGAGLTISSNTSTAVTVGTISSDSTYYPISAVIKGTAAYTTAGWASSTGELTATSQTIGTIAAGTHTIGALTLNGTTALTSGSTTLVAASHYYVKCDTTTGYQPASSTYIDLGASTHSIGSVTKNGTTAANGVAANSYYVQCTSTAGYTAGDSVYKDIGAATISGGSVTYNSTSKAFVATASTTAAGYIASGVTAAATSKTITVGSGATLTTATTSKSIAANTYYPSAATVSVSYAAGTLADGSGTNANLSSTTLLGDLTGDTTFTGSSNKFLSSFKVEVADTIAALQAI